MRVATFEIRIRLDSDDEVSAILRAKAKIMDVDGSLSVTQIGPVVDTHPIDSGVYAKGREQ